MNERVRIRRVVSTLWATAALALIPAVGVFADNGNQGQADSESQIQRGYQISPIPTSQLNLAGKNRALVGLGSYIVNTTGCNDCHTWPNYAPGHDPFAYPPQTEQINVAGYLAGGRPFGPGLLSANITPDSGGLPAHLTFPEFLVTLRTGHNPNDPPGGAPLQVMPWPVIGKKTDRDLLAIYQYLSSIPCIEGEPGDPTAPARCQ